MALFVRQTEERTKLQQRIAAELQEKSRARSAVEPPDGVTDSNYLKDTKTTTSLAWVWILIVVFAVGGLIAVILNQN